MANSSPPDAGHGIGFAHDPGQPLGDTAQHVVARDTPEPIVDFLATINVEAQQGQRAVLPPCPGCGMGQAIVEQIPVRKIGEQIVVGLVGEALQPWLALDRVAHGAQQRRAAVSSVDPKILRPVHRIMGSANSAPARRASTTIGTPGACNRS